VEPLLDIADKNNIFNLTSREFNKFSSAVMLSLELQMLRKVDTEITEIGGIQHVCQSCWGFVGYLHEHCPNCGQAIDWSEE
jgi:rRNA maturation endonuclease Nob1